MNNEAKLSIDIGVLLGELLQRKLQQRLSRWSHEGLRSCSFEQERIQKSFKNFDLELNLALI
jgi:hypothetical protein